MALDQAMAEASAAGGSPPTLRFYRWQPPAVSLGRHQKITDIDVEVARRKGYEIVRRPTGGRAILHIDELTYSVVAAADDPGVRGGVMDAYLRLSNALLAGLQSLGLPHVNKAAAGVRAGPDVSAACFEVPSAYEITANGRKLMGSAQSRRAGYVLQHGSLPLVGEITRLVDILALSPTAATGLRTDLAERACTLAQALETGDDDPRLQFEFVADHLAEGFRTGLGMKLEPGVPSAGELKRTALLIREQYADPGWTDHR
jgi:lipoate-protein ligase A